MRPSRRAHTSCLLFVLARYWSVSRSVASIPAKSMLRRLRTHGLSIRPGWVSLNRVALCANHTPLARVQRPNKEEQFNTKFIERGCE